MTPLMNMVVLRFFTMSVVSDASHFLMRQWSYTGLTNPDVAEGGRYVLSDVEERYVGATRDVMLGTQVAVKRLFPSLYGHNQDVEDFVREGTLLASLHHP